MTARAEHAIAFIAITYRSDRAAIEFARQIAAVCGRIDVAGIIVDNESRAGDGLGPALRSVNPHIHYLQVGGNPGYFTAAARGREWLIENGITPKWTVVCNADLEFDGEMFAHRLLALRFASWPGVVAPSIISARTGMDQNPNMVRRPPAGRMHFYRLVFGRFWLRWIYETAAVLAGRARAIVRGRRTPRTDVRVHDQLQPIYAPHGACIAFSDAYFIGGGSLSYPEVLYGEEVFVAETCRKLGLSVLYAPSIRIVHLEHTSTDTMSPREVASYAAASSSRIAQEYFTSRKAAS